MTTDTPSPTGLLPDSPAKRPRRLRSWSNLLGAALILYFDLVLDGSYLFSSLFCPMWFLVSMVKNLIQRPGWGTAVFRISTPALVLGTSIGNTAIQWKIADANGERIVRACEEFRSANGRYPKTLDELVPRHLSSIPPAKYCLHGEFSYSNSVDGSPSLIWNKFGLCHKVYSFRTKQWGLAD